jgi:hypothetical protein
MATKILLAPLRGRNSKFSKLYVVGILNFCLEMPGTMQKKLGQSDHPVERKRPKHSKFRGYFETTKLDHVLEVFSGHGDRIELIPFALCQATQYTSLEYPQHIIARNLNCGP